MPGLDYTNNKVYIHRKQFKPLYIGVILKDVDTLFVHDRDNYFIALNALGIDTEVLTSRLLHFRYVQIKYRGMKLMTTRKYFYDHATPANLMNGREMLFLPVPKFGLDAALEYERIITDDQKLSQMDLFEVAETMRNTDSPNLLNLWLKSVAKAEQVNLEIKRKKIL